MMILVIERGTNTLGIGARQIGQRGVKVFANLSCAPLLGKERQKITAYDMEA